ncbi:hypothetical protein TNCT_450541 [Trichonephila clavata]|uniref:Uncharacterized protein n=1 Tax=Trichonephila clavata TaxID=2740835 RepID=A0A8X6FDU5_TRICU|nr:hypothetical protein TNCT_450541 [Trichonephila clavata]
MSDLEANANLEQIDDSQSGSQPLAIIAEWVCHNLSVLCAQVRMKEHRLSYIKGVFDLEEKFQFSQKSDLESLRSEGAKLEMELQTLYGEIALVS